MSVPPRALSPAASSAMNLGVRSAELLMPAFADRASRRHRARPPRPSGSARRIHAPAPQDASACRIQRSRSFTAAILNSEGKYSRIPREPSWFQRLSSVPASNVARDQSDETQLTPRNHHDPLAREYRTSTTAGGLAAAVAKACSRGHESEPVSIAVTGYERMNLCEPVAESAGRG